MASSSGKEFPGVSKDGDVFGDMDMIAESYNGHVGPSWTVDACDSIKDKASCLQTKCEWLTCLRLRRTRDFSDQRPAPDLRPTTIVRW